MNILSTLLTAEQQEALRAQKIVTPLDFVQCNNDRLASILGCNVSQVIKIHEKILAANNIQAVRSDQLLKARMKNTFIVETGIAEYNELCMVMVIAMTNVMFSFPTELTIFCKEACTVEP